MAGGGKEKLEYDKDRVDEVVLALLYLTTFEGELGLKTWKNIDLGVLTRLYEKGFISNPLTGSKSVAISREAADQSRELFRKYFETKKEKSGTD